MKVRIQHNSIRFRLKEPEVAYFKKHGFIKETLVLGNDTGAQLQFALQVTSDEILSAHYLSNMVTINVPAHTADAWTETDLVGFDGVVNTVSGSPLKVLVEKDFKCLDGSEEDNIGSYPNPMQHC